MKNLIFLLLCLVGYQINDSLARAKINGPTLCFPGNRCFFDEECGLERNPWPGASPPFINIGKCMAGYIKDL